MRTIAKEGSRPIHIWTDDVEASAMQQLANMATLPFLHPHGLAVMPDVHMGIGSTVGTVIATHKAIIPAACGVDIGCGVLAVQTSLAASGLPDSLAVLRRDIERGIPLGAGGAHQKRETVLAMRERVPVDPVGSEFSGELVVCEALFDGDITKFFNKAASQLGTLGSGNHFIEICLDEKQNVWVMLHSGSRGIGNMIGRHFIEKAKRHMERYFVTLADVDLAYLPEDTADFKDYVAALEWAQDYAAENRQQMMQTVLRAMQHRLPEFSVVGTAINAHHNYVALESHFGRNVYVTRKGAVRAREGDMAAIPGSMGTRSYIVRGKGNPDSYHSCAHGAGRRMSRTEAKRRFTLDDLIAQTQGVECARNASVIDEIPSAYKDVDVVMANQSDLVEVVATLKQILCVKGS